MATAYSTLLGLALPVTGELSGTWGDTVNNSITSLLDSAIAGTTTLSTDADVTLSNLDGTADTSRQAILLWTAGGTVTRTVIAPALSKIYTVINASSSTQSIKVTGPGPTTGVTIIKGEAAMIAWNGSDFVKVSNTGGSFTTQDLTVTGNTILGDAITDTTTLNAQTRFQSRGILGYANMTGPATTSLTTTAPAFLYSGATTYTVSDVSGGTQAFAPVISLDQATITNATTTTIYTNAATLYIAGAPNRTGLVTFTNSYALYVAAGNVYLGGGTANGVAYLDTNKVLTTGSALTFDGSGAFKSSGTTNGFLSSGTFVNSSNGASAVNRVQIGNDASDGSGQIVVYGSQHSTLSNVMDINNAQNAALRFLTNNTERARIDSSGNLGIGTTSPAVKLDITGYEMRILAPASGKSTSVYADASGSAIGYLSSGYLAFGSTTSIVSSQFTERARIDSSGNLGIGTTTPSSFSKLAVSGAANVYGDERKVATLIDTTALAAGVGAGISFYGVSESGGGVSQFGSIKGIKENATASNYAGALAFVTSTSANVQTERMRLDSSGNLSVGTTAVAPARLSIRGAGTTSATASFEAANSAGNTRLYVQDDGTTRFYGSSGSESARIDSSGNLGIGATTPTQKLVLSSADTTGTAINIINTSTGGYSWNIFSVGSSSVMGNVGSLAFRDSTNGVTRVTIDSSGVLLVGTTGLPVANGSALSLSGSGDVARIFGTTTANPGLVIDKSANTSTTAQVFVTFTINSQGTGSGQINANGASQAAFGSFSDFRLKQNIVDLPSQLANIMALRPVEFDYIESEGGGHQTGFIAQEMETIFPDSVGERSDGMKTVTGWNKTEAILIKAIQEQQALITTLTARITALEGA